MDPSEFKRKEKKKRANNVVFFWSYGQWLDNSAYGAFQKLYYSH